MEVFNDFITPAARHHPGHRPDRLGQDHHALLGAASTIATREINITTIEDPIEMVYEEFNQTAVQTKIGITFAEALRHILRQDPDVIMVGEIRDSETAQYAIQAALTGHLVFSTLHTNDAATSISRLIDLGVEPLPHQLDAGRRDGAAPGAPHLPALLDRALPRRARRCRRCACRCRRARGSR